MEGQSTKYLSTTLHTRQGHERQGTTKKLLQTATYGDRGLNATWCPGLDPGAEKGY